MQKDIQVLSNSQYAVKCIVEHFNKWILRNEYSKNNLELIGKIVKIQNQLQAKIVYIRTYQGELNYYQSGLLKSQFLSQVAMSGYASNPYKRIIMPKITVTKNDSMCVDCDKVWKKLKPYEKLHQKVVLLNNIRILTRQYDGFPIIKTRFAKYRDHDYRMMEEQIAKQYILSDKDQKFFDAE